ncbi:MAG: hypothetical protein MJE66_09660, partial [Proteobacteria bacterium]|nr:hypothetical protein [Pseudomonadota bacterium]
MAASWPSWVNLPPVQEWSPGWAVVLAVLGLVALGRALRLRGDLAVGIEYPAELRGRFRVRLGTGRESWLRQPAPPRSDLLKAGVATSREHPWVSRETRFRRLPTGRYAVRVEGMLLDPDTSEVLKDVCETLSVAVRGRRTAQVEFDLHPEDCPLDLEVSWDGRPARDAAVATLTARGLPRAVHDARGGPLRLHLPKGTHTLLVGSGDRVVQQEIQVQTFQPTAVRIDIARSDNVVFKGCPPAVEPYLAGDFQAAAQALERDGQEREAHLLLAELHQEHGRPERAADHFESADELVKAAELHAQVSDFSRAADLYARANEHVRAAEMYRLAGSWLRAGEAYEAILDFESAAHCYREAGEIDKWIDARERRGEAFEAAQIALEHGQATRANRLLQRVLPGDPHFAEACLQLAETFEREGHFDLAAQKLEERLAATGPGAFSPDLYSRRALLLERGGRIERALELLEDLRRREPTYPNIASRIELRHKERSARRLSDLGADRTADLAPTVFLAAQR